jgi:hypothetical protein
LNINLKEFDLDVTTTYPPGQGRRYCIDGSDCYPSVTTVIGHDNDFSWWRNKVGEAEADRISKAACDRGTAVHEDIENYILHQNEGVHPLFDNIKPLIDKIDNIIGMETFLYNPHIEMAGRVDCIGEFDGELSIIDFKTSTKMKIPKYLNNYWLQTTAYSLMWEHLTGQRIDILVILMVAANGETKAFKSNRNKWLMLLYKKIQDYKEFIK